MSIEVGKKFFVDFGKGHPSTGKNEIRAIVDKEYVVLKFKSKKRQGWGYELQHISFFDVFNSKIKWLK